MPQAIFRDKKLMTSSLLPNENIYHNNRTRGRWVDQYLERLRLWRGWPNLGYIMNFELTGT